MDCLGFAPWQLQLRKRTRCVDVPGMSVPQKGCDETALKPVLVACIIHEQLLASSCPKSVLAKSKF